ncbi:hypothetical protein EG329_012484 [Mollisiaceae sp. DMI_Dod_QoI]|nr:hypothetical protein EG329_012484 [Helotiales sp. DMI_Dod_QoI]
MKLPLLPVLAALLLTLVSPVVAQSETITVQVTTLLTITSCDPTVSDCPASTHQKPSSLPAQKPSSHSLPSLPPPPSSQPSSLSLPSYGPNSQYNSLPPFPMNNTLRLLHPSRQSLLLQQASLPVPALMIAASSNL